MRFEPGRLYRLKKLTPLDIVTNYKHNVLNIRKYPPGTVITFIREEEFHSIQYRFLRVDDPVFIFEGIRLRFTTERLQTNDEVLEDYFELVETKD